MSNPTVTAVLTFEIFTCTCGGVYALASGFMKRARDAANSKIKWACPYCKTNWAIPGRTEEQKQIEALAAERDKLKRYREIAEEQLARTERELKSRKFSNMALKGQITKLRNKCLTPQSPPPTTSESGSAS